MGENVIFLRPVEKVGVVYDILKSCKHTTFPVVDTDDGGVLFGTIGRNALCVLLKQRAFDSPTDKEGGNTRRLSNSLAEKYVPIVEWYQVEKAYPKYPSVKDTRLNSTDRDCFLDLRPYANQAPITVQEQASVAVSTRNRLCALCFLSVIDSVWRSLHAFMYTSLS
jgi:chloride channel 7